MFKFGLWWAKTKVIKRHAKRRPPSKFRNSLCQSNRGTSLPKLRRQEMAVLLKAEALI